MLCVTVITMVAACTTPLPPVLDPRTLKSRMDSLVEARMRDSSPEYRAIHFPTLGLHDRLPRPALAAGADTNDAGAYYRLGDSVGFRQQGVADRAFYWATRLDPMMANAYLARWELRTEGVTYRLYPDDTVRRSPKPTPSERAAIDSLRVTALMYDPFLDQALGIPSQINNLKEWQANRDPVTAGFWWYAKGDFAKAVKKWGDAIRKKPEYAGLHVPRAFAWVHLGDADSAVADLTALIGVIQRIQDSTVAPYLSKDFLYYAIGTLRGGQKRLAEARSAYESTLVENLGFYMAHMRLSAVLLALHDTTAALNELETATLMRSDDPVLHTLRAGILDGSRRLDEAELELRAAMRADTDYALPYAFLGHVGEQRHDTTRALRAYREFIVRASHAAPERGWVEDHLKRLTKQP
jgi:Tfp pilus assembly protein PilF